jgi:predicted ATPase
MITKWKLFNFKSVRRETELELAPLTILAGPNSSGKSTWTQSMLLISQTLANRVRSRSVVLNGNLAKLGQFDDLRSFGSEADQIFINFECSPQTNGSSAIPETSRSVRRQSILFGRRFDYLKNVSCEVSIDIDPSAPQRDLMQLQPRLFGCALSALIRTEDNLDLRVSITTNRTIQQRSELESVEIPEPDSEAVLSSLDYRVELDKESMEELCGELTSVELVGCIFRHFLPSSLSIRFNKVEMEAHQIASIICDTRSRFPSWGRYLGDNEEIIIPASVIKLLKERLGEVIDPVIEPSGQQLTLFPLEAVSLISARDWYERVRKLNTRDRVKLRQIMQEQDQEGELSEEIRKSILNEKESQYVLIQAPLPRGITDATRYLDFFFSNSVKYLGPLRDEPKPLYPLAATVDPSDIGLRGEYTAAVLDLHKEDFISYLPSANFNEPSVKRQPATRSLEAAVLDWLQYMGIAEKVETRDRGKLGHELKITTSDLDKPQDLTHVGVGVSQVLPIVVMCLLADKDTTLIIEQPELHLHPKVQTLLADFFLSMAILGKQCIIETHSEYVINRLRFRAASAAEDALSSIMKIYFVEKKAGVSSFRDVVVNKYGAITDWPEGFFDQSQDEAEEILRAATLKRKKERGAKKDA